MPTRIPERLIQTARTRHLSLKQRAMSTNLRLLNPGYEWAFFDDADVERFVDREFPKYRKVFDDFRFPIQRYDFFRYLAAYRLGGFYFDLDVILARPLSDLLSFSCVYPFEGLTHSRLLRGKGMDWEIGNYAFGSSPGHPFLEAVIENCIKGQRDQRWVSQMMRGAPLFSRAAYYVLYTTGPGVLSRTLVENPALAQDVTVLFPDDVCDTHTWNVFGEYGVHMMEGTWRPEVSAVRRRLAQRIEDWATQRLIKQSRQLGKKRSLTTVTSSS
jgi:hypothetical protein